MSIIRLLNSPSYTLYYKKPRIGPTGLTIIPPVAPPFIPDFYISPTGGTGSGSILDPWSMTYGFNGGGGAVTPGKQVEILGGTYNGNFTVVAVGTSTQPVIFRQAPGQRATISGSLSVNGDYAWVWGIEVLNTSPTTSIFAGVNQTGKGSKLINLVVHDAGRTGIYSAQVASGGGVSTEVYGCIVYNNGTVNNQDHGIYVLNAGFPARIVSDNIVFCNWSIGIQPFATAPQTMDNIHLTNNILFNTHTIGTSGGADLFIGAGDVQAVGAVLTRNAVYRNDSAKATSIGYFLSPGNQDLLFDNNYIVGVLEIDDWTSAIVTNNTVYSTTLAAAFASGLMANRGNISNHTYSGNTFYGIAAANQCSYGIDSAHFTPMTFATWLATVQGINPVGFANVGSFTNGAPTGQIVFLYPNIYEAGRANIAVYNWSGLGSVAVDVSNVLNIGDQYVVLNAENFYGTPATFGTYVGLPINIPLTAVAPPAPVGRGVAGPTTGPTFGAFILRLAGS